MFLARPIGPLSVRTHKLSAPFAVLLGLSLIVPQLSYFREPPLVDFFGEWASAFLFAVAALFAVKLLPNRLRVSSWFVAVPLGIVATMAVQFALGRYAYISDPILWTGYLSLFFIAALVAQAALATNLKRELGDRLCWTFLLIGVVNLCLQILQITGLESLAGPFIIKLVPETVCRPFGNISQANHASTMAWSAILGAIYLSTVGRIKVAVAAPIVAALLFSSALTGSRMPWLYCAVASGVLFLASGWISSFRNRALVATGLFAGFAIASAIAIPVFENISGHCVSALERFSGSRGSDYMIRYEMWREALMVWIHSPLIGSGVGSFMGQVYNLQPVGLHMPLDYFPHNMALQFLAELGIVGAGLVTAAVLVWLFQLIRARELLGPLDAMLVAWLGVIGVHAMLEFPLHYVQWVIPFGLALGLLIRPDWSLRGRVVSAKLVVVLLSLALLSGLAWTFVDHARLSRLIFLTDLRKGLDGANAIELDAQIRRTNESVHLYRWLADHVVGIGFDPALNDANLAATHYDRLLHKAPTIDSIYRRITAAVVTGDLDGARLHLQRMFMFFPTRQQEMAELMRKNMERFPTELAGFAPILEEELARAPKARW